MLEILFQVIWFLIKLPFYILYYLGLGIWLLVEWIIENSSSNKKIVSSIGTLTEEETLNKLTPLIISKDLINYFQIGNESVTIKDLKNNNGILNYKCQESSNSKKMTITLYKEGVAIAFRRKCYFTPFDSNTNCVVYKKYKEVELDHFDPISFMKKVVDSDYFYYFSKSLTSYTADTRHYTKEGKLDKRYSKQNLQTGGAHYSATERFYKSDGYDMYIKVGKIKINLSSNQEAVYDLFKIIYSQIGKQIPLFTKLIKDSPYYKVIPLLTEEDRENIRTLLNKPVNEVSHSISEEFEKRTAPTRLVNNILRERRNEF